MSFTIPVTAELEEKYEFNSCSIWSDKTYKKNREPDNETFFWSSNMFIRFSTSRYLVLPDYWKYESKLYIQVASRWVLELTLITIWVSWTLRENQWLVWRLPYAEEKDKREPPIISQQYQCARAGATLTPTSGLLKMTIKSPWDITRPR